MDTFGNAMGVCLSGNEYYFVNGMVENFVRRADAVGKTVQTMVLISHCMLSNPYSPPIPLRETWMSCHPKFKSMIAAPLASRSAHLCVRLSIAEARGRGHLSLYPSTSSMGLGATTTLIRSCQLLSARCRRHHWRRSSHTSV